MTSSETDTRARFLSLVAKPSRQREARALASEMRNAWKVIAESAVPDRRAAAEASLSWWECAHMTALAVTSLAAVGRSAA